jgi:hypothetical protein
MLTIGDLRRKLRRSDGAFRKHYFADVPVNLDAIVEYRNDAFPASGPACWLDQPDALLAVEHRLSRGAITAEDAQMCRQWIVDGYYIARGLIDHALLDRTWEAYEKAIRDGTVVVDPESHGEGDPYPGRKLDPHLKVPEIATLQGHPSILRITDLLLGKETIPFQTIMGHKGSGQRPHSDAIHMTTYPLGFLVANWIAFEDIHPDSGPLEYYPKSHRLLPYLLSREVGIAPREFKEKGYGVYSERYEPAVQHYLAAYGLSPQFFCPSKGDVLFWHANLVHGGSPRKDLKYSRRALVCHYFAKGAVTYHDLSGNRSRLHRAGMYSVIQRG